MNQTITTLKQDLESNMKLEGFSEIYRGVILKYMDKAYQMGKEDQKQPAYTLPDIITEVPTDAFKNCGDNQFAEIVPRLKTWQEDH